MSLLTIFKNNTAEGSRQAAPAPASLAQIWDEAAELGGVRVWQYLKGHDYKASIVFVRDSGSEIEATGRGMSIGLALGQAIDEARRLKSA